MDKPAMNNEDGLAELFKREFDILSKLSHNNLIKLFQKIETKKYIYLIFEYCELGDLEKYMKKLSPQRLYNNVQKFRFVEEQAKMIFI